MHPDDRARAARFVQYQMSQWAYRQQAREKRPIRQAASLHQSWSKSRYQQTMATYQQRWL